MVCPVCGEVRWRTVWRRLDWTFTRCDSCGLLRLDPIPSEAELAEYYGRRARAGNYELDRAGEREVDLQHVLDFAVRSGARTGTLFDVGCFDGGLLDVAAARGWEGWGLELQEEAVEAARRRHPGRIFHGTLEGFDPQSVPTFDLVTAIDLVEHLREPTTLFETGRRLLRPGGLLVVQTPNRESWPARLLGRYWPPIAPPEHIFYFGRSTIERIGAKYGFDRVAARPVIKRIRVGYAYQQFQYFGPEFHRLLGPVVRRLPARALATRLPLYGGEILFAARLRAG